MDEFSDVDETLLALASSPLAMVMLSEFTRDQLKALVLVDDQRLRLQRYLRLFERLPELPVPGGLSELHDYLDARIDAAQRANGVRGHPVPRAMLNDWQNPDIDMPLLRKLIVLTIVTGAHLSRFNSRCGAMSVAGKSCLPVRPVQSGSLANECHHPLRFVL
ncbi:hypothetical protein [Mycolicibacterium bacteremicum]|uniref:hypothetical protein n=1 Tax=Mycolicibacterium bacteremicum TaxID=564198 RepID=UPI0026E9427F|nr:hypothetical protein [Mycolicibacterium bacteremicum]